MTRSWVCGLAALAAWGASSSAPASALASTPASAPAGAAAQAPYVGASEADNEFHRITAADMEIIRSKRVLFGSRSSGLCMRAGLGRLAAQKPIYALPTSPAYRLSGSEAAEIPDEAPKTFALIHYLFTLGLANVRAKELDGLISRFGPQLDAAMLDLHVLGPDYASSRSPQDLAPIAPLIETMERLRKDHPKVRFVYTTTRLVPDPNNPGNEMSWQLTEGMLRKYRGQVPIYDWRSLLSTRADGTTAGHFTCLEFNINNDKMHPNSDFAKERLARAYLVMMYKLFCSPGLVANAGFDRTVTADGGAGAARVRLDASASVDNKDPSRRLARYVWREGDKVLAEGDKPTAEVSLPLGVHTITLTVTDGQNPPQTSSDEVRITVAKP